MPNSDAKCATAHEPVTAGDSSEGALAETIRLAARAGQWDVVRTLSGVLDAEKKAAAGVVDFQAAKKARER